MTNQVIIKHIDDGVTFYLDFCGDAIHMESTDNGVYCIIRPLPGEQGISFVYNIRLEGLPKDQQLEKIEEIKRLNMPVWFNLRTSEELYQMIYGKSREKEPHEPSDEYDLYMAATCSEQIPAVLRPDGAAIIRVRDAHAFAVWTRSVNDWLHGGNQYVHPQNHYHACKSDEIRCYICYKDKHPVSVCMIMNNNGICSLEFVATHPDFRRRGFAKTICAFAMKEAFADGAEIITLRAGNPGTRELYTSLGFNIYNYVV